ncbi:MULTISPECIES: hypothetical protein [unclassified Sphingomonas]|uniref:hypothetical protein n=1 Tax=unclassified Sphingomonas TaxID=196159 RepID=UPI0006F4BFF3|nr:MULTISPECIES: hypothetical protein [unclassified Sphingomonas]KQM59939.1 hypothetical protein ASE65_09420 [Sphingomonas sp. Leaf16]KQN11337.1 hypothetical protein ASE81_10405 [Sphingomonas sp. Leaf29]KQN18659.1 hypothetical protein ASE83_10350 [Sphingomonas sp. Leaf32]
MAKLSLGSPAKLGLGVAIGLAIGAAGGAGAVSLTRPGVEMAPTVATPVARLASSSGVVTVKGRVAEVYGDRFVVQDGSGKAMVDGGRDANVTKGAPVQVQGRYDDGQLRASYVVDAAGKVTPVGPPPRRGHGPEGRGPGPHGPGGPGGPEARGPGGPGGPGCAPGAMPPPPPPADGAPPVANASAPAGVRATR